MFIRPSGDGRVRVRAALAAVLGTSLTAWAPHAMSAAPAAGEEAEEEAQELDEVQVTGSRIIRRDTQSNSPLVTVDRARLEESTYISIEQALNELPQFMAGGIGMSAGTVTSQTGQGSLDGGAGSGTMFDNVRLPETGGRVGTFTPGAATVNLRGLGSNRSLTLIDGHRGQPTNASMSLDLNTIPSAAIGNIEVISGGASAVYGADALAGVTNIKLRDDFQGLEVRLRGGVNEVGDGGEYQVSTLLGTRLGEGKGNAMIGLEYSKREVAFWKNRDFFLEAMEHPRSAPGIYSFGWWPAYDASTGTLANAGCTTTAGVTTCTTGSNSALAGGGSLQGGVWAGNRPTQAAVDAVFADRTCGTAITCVANTGTGGGFYFNSDGTLFTRSSSCLYPAPTTTTPNPANPCPGQQAPQGTTQFYGPQGYIGTATNTPLDPDKISCTYANNQLNTMPGFAGSCSPTLQRVDWDRWLTSPREAFNLFGRGRYQINDRLTSYSTLSFAQSEVRTRREPAPATGTFTAAIPYHSNPDAKYLPSIQQTDLVSGGVVIRRAGDTLPEYRVGGARGTSCPDTGGCTMQQAFPVSDELRTLLNSRPNVIRTGTPNPDTNPYGGLSVCELRTRDFNDTLPGHAAQIPASGGRPAHTVQIDPNTGETFKICGPDSAWRHARMYNFLPPRGTENQQRTWQLSTGLTGDTGFSDWTWDLFTSYGDARTATEYLGLASQVNYRKIVQAPNYGMGYREENTNAAKIMTCTSGLNPFDPDLVISQDCIDAIASNQIDRNSMIQRVHELNLQGHVLDLPAGEMRAAAGVSYRKNSYTFTADSLRERDYIADTSPGQFGIGYVDAGVSVKEFYGELLVPLLRDLPGVQVLELELGARSSRYSTGQNVPTFKVLASWQPVSWIRARGGYNRAERAPNIAELYTAPTTNTAGAPTDPCVTSNAGLLQINARNRNDNPNYLLVQALCSAQIDLWGGNGASEFQANPNSFTIGGGVATVLGNENLKSEKGQTWTAGVVLSSPFTHPLLSRSSATVDWYEVRIDDPVDVLTAQSIANACFNAAGENPTYSLDDPGGYCRLMERDPTTGQHLRTTTPYANQGKLVLRGLDASLRWSASLADMGLGSAPGTFSVNVNANYLIDQIQPLTAGGVARDYVGLSGAAQLRGSTSTSYSWGAHRVSLTWQYRQGTRVATAGTNEVNPNVAGYHTVNMFNATAGTRIGAVDASVSVSNLLDTAPGWGGYQFADPAGGVGSYNPFGDLVGRRYSVNLTMKF